MPDYVPRRDSDLVSWSFNFVENIGNSFKNGLFAEHVTSVQALQQAFVDAYTLAVDPSR